MARTSVANYQSFMEGPSVEEDETPHEGGVIIHMVPEAGRSKWNLIEDLDSFFTRMYQYHQKHGFTCMMLQEILELGQFVFVVCFSVFLFHCVNYPVLFNDVPKSDKNSTKIVFSDAILPLDECLKTMNILTWVSLLIAFIFWLLRVVIVLYHFIQYWEIKCFFNTALKISDNELDNLTWHEVQKRIRDVQKEHEICIHKKDLTELDIYHRILRFKNYMVAMWNKNLIPVHINVPFLGTIVYFTRGYKYNVEMLLFWGPGSPFENNWHLREDYKKVAKRKELADALSKFILWVSVANFVLCPVILLWQILYSFFNYAQIIRREPGSLGSRWWSLHGRLYLRHFNELDHELNARLNRAYRPASKYMNIFTSPIMTVIATNVAFVAGAMLAVLLILTFYDEDVITVEHVMSAMALLGAIVAGCRVFIPDENLVWCPEQLMTAVLAHAHYLPDNWRGQAHTTQVRLQFAQLFQYKAVYLIEELLSPIITPYMLCFHLRPKALEIVDFYRQFTVEVVGVGDVCSFAQMDIRKHGNPSWQPEADEQQGQIPENNQYTQAEDGKTELSLIHFTLTNPHWRPPAAAETFVTRLRAQATKEAEMLEYNTAGFNNPLCTSLHSVSSLGAGYNTLATSVLRFRQMRGSQQDVSRRAERTNPFLNINQNSSSQIYNEDLVLRGGLSRTEGPLLPDKGVLLGSDTVESSELPLNYERGTLRGLTMANTSLGASVFGSGQEMLNHEPLELTTADMALSTLYLHELHHRQIRRRGASGGVESCRSVWSRPHQDMPGIQEQQIDEGSETLQKKHEKLPLLKKPF